MYIIANKLSFPLHFRGHVIAPNEQIPVVHSQYDTIAFKKVDETLILEVTSTFGLHTPTCSDKIICSPPEGKDGTTFMIRRK